MPSRPPGPDPEDFAGVLLEMMSLARSMPEVAELYHAFSDAVAAVAKRGDGEAEGAKSGRQRGPRKDPFALAMRANALLWASQVRYWSAWQRLAMQRLPQMRRQMAGGRRGATPDAESVDDLRAYLREMMELPAEEFKRVRDGMLRLEQELADADPLPAGRRMHAAKD